MFLKMKVIVRINNILFDMLCCFFIAYIRSVLEYDFLPMKYAWFSNLIADPWEGIGNCTQKNS